MCNFSHKYGKPVHGEATITAFPTIFSGVIQPIFQTPIRKVVKIDGSATVDFDIENDLKLNDEYERVVMVDVIVEEQPTGRHQNNSVEVRVHKYDYQMELIKSADYFKPGLKYIAYVSYSISEKVKQWKKGNGISFSQKIMFYCGTTGLKFFCLFPS